jgi:hypothetical protein
VTQFFDNFWNDFNDAIYLRVGVEATERKAQTAPRAIRVRVHRTQHVRTFLRTRAAG